MPNITDAKQLCDRFIREMENNRKGYDDAGVARNILLDLGRHGHVSADNERRLSRWCHTDGNLYKRGGPIAQQISVALYDRVIPRQ